jgi:two-component system, chemotaxis family, response regulator Rcp1
MENKKTIELLLVEDNPGDVRLIEEALKDSKRISKIHVVSDGVEAADFLFKRKNYLNARVPDLIILDINLPKKDGIELLTEIKEDEKLKKIPVVMLTSSKAEDDILKTYKLHASCYITKPSDFNNFIEKVKAIEDLIKNLV